MSAATVDDQVLREVWRRRRAAAVHYQRALDELLPAVRALERHPDFARTERLEKAGRPSAERLTLAWWIHNGLMSTLDDMPVRDAGKFLLEDDERTMRLFIRTEEEDLRRFARRRVARRRGVRPRPGRRRPIAPQRRRARDAGILVNVHGHAAAR